MIATIGLLIGVIIGFVFDVNLPSSLAPYLSVAILACIDSVFGAIKANLSKTYHTDIFVLGFFGNSLLAVALAYLGDKLGIPMYMAAVIVFGERIFNNFAEIRRLIIANIRKRHRGEASEDKKI